MFQDNLSIPSSRVKKSKNEKMACYLTLSSFSGLYPLSYFLKKQDNSASSIYDFRQRSTYQGRQLRQIFSINRLHRNTNLLRYVPENRSSQWVVTGKWLLKNWKLTTRLKNKTWTNQQIKNHKKKHELRLIKPEIWNKNPKHIHLNFQHH
jgi:hypothetical protein